MGRPRVSLSDKMNLMKSPFLDAAGDIRLRQPKLTWAFSLVKRQRLRTKEKDFFFFLSFTSLRNFSCGPDGVVAPSGDVAPPADFRCEKRTGDVAPHWCRGT